jgi:hypothetical protein
MRKLYLLLIVFSLFYTANSQIIITNDTTVCGNYTDTLYALSATTSSIAVDDGHGSIIPLGFTFNFYGQSYTQIVISGNGYLTFDLSLANSYSPWSIGSPIPNPGSVPQNAILCPWHDLNPTVNPLGGIYFGTVGVAPNRMFIVTWCSVAMYSCTNLLHTSQVVLYEGSDKIEMYLQDKPLCAGWNGGNAIQGLVDATSANADIVNDPISGLDRNFGTQWTAINEGWEFIPNGSTAYTISQIPYVPIIAGTTTWYDIAGNQIGVGGALPVSITTTTTYLASMTGTCIPLSVTDTVTISVPDCYSYK